MVTEELVPSTWGTFWDHFGETLVRLLEIKDGSNVLDIGTGGGANLYPAAKRVGETGSVTSVELCEHCVNKANGEIQRCSISNAEVLLKDACETGFPDSNFDYVIAGFIGWDDYFDFKKGEFVADDVLTKEILRVLKPGGYFGLSTWLNQEDLDWMKRFLNSHDIECRTNYHAEHEEGWRIIMKDKGLINLRFVVEIFYYTYPSVDNWWKEMMDYNWIEDKENGEFITSDIKSDARGAIKEHMTGDGGVRFSRTAIFMTAEKI
ncbi:MAG: class I SAM-dependent methyltransferase [Candidatus Thorarchaeota archaeon]|nr:class I SAM-dependent methyltransferase [Candidatus Thorarchaeota archaeon]